MKALDLARLLSRNSYESICSAKIWNSFRSTSSSHREKPLFWSRSLSRCSGCISALPYPPIRQRQRNVFRIGQLASRFAPLVPIGPNRSDWLWVANPLHVIIDSGTCCWFSLHSIRDDRSRRKPSNRLDSK